MSATSKDPITLRPTPEQQPEVRRAAGRDAETIELSVRDLEERVTPRLAANHNETRLALPQIRG